MQDDPHDPSDLGFIRQQDTIDHYTLEQWSPPRRDFWFWLVFVIWAGILTCAGVAAVYTLVLIFESFA